MPGGDKLRMQAKIGSVEEVSGGAQIVTELTFEREGDDKPGVRGRAAGARVHRIARESADRAAGDADGRRR